MALSSVQYQWLSLKGSAVSAIACMAAPRTVTGCSSRASMKSSPSRISAVKGEGGAVSRSAGIGIGLRGHPAA